MTRTNITQNSSNNSNDNGNDNDNTHNEEKKGLENLVTTRKVEGKKEQKGSKE